MTSGFASVRFVLSFDAFPRLAGLLLERLVGLAEADDQLVAVTVGGSAALGTMDHFSDLDLVIVCRDDGYRTAVAEARRLAGSLGPLLVAFTGEHVGEPALLICLYGPPLLHVDLKYVAESEFADRVEDGLILWQRDGAAEAAFANSDAAWPAPDRQWIEDRFWVWIHYGAAKLGRGELFECLDLLGFLRGAVLGPLLAVERGTRPQGARRIEFFAPDYVPALAATIADHDRQQCFRALRAAAEAYVELRDRAADPELVQHTEAQAQVMAYLEVLG
jgi:predicted nucleotidyltransferase